MVQVEEEVVEEEEVKGNTVEVVVATMHRRLSSRVSRVWKRRFRWRPSETPPLPLLLVVVVVVVVVVVG